MLKNLYKTDILVILCISILVTVFFIRTGTLFSGYHFLDDHEIIRINNDLKVSSLFSVITEWAGNDFNIRFRPFYYVHRVILVKLFGLNFLLWYGYHLIMLNLTLGLLYLSCRKLKISVTVSLLFPIIAIVGSQLENWWRLGTSENIGVLFLALSFYYLKESEGDKNRHKIYFSLSLIMSALCKESFIIIIPSMLFLKLFLNFQNNRSLIKKIISLNWPLLFPFFCFIFFIYIIYFYIGTNSIGYAGVDAEPKLTDLFHKMITIVKEELYYYWIIMLSAVIFSLFSVKDDIVLIPYLRNLAGLVFFLLLFVIPLLILYAKSGMNDRYMLPATVGISYFFTALFKETGSKISWQNICLFCICAWVVYIKGHKMNEEAMKFAVQGKNVKNLIQSIVTRAKSKSQIVLAFDPILSNEAAFSLKTYLESIHQIQLHAFFIDRKSIFSNKSLSETLLNNAKIWFKDKMFDPLKNKHPDILVFLNKGLRIYFFSETPIDPESYKNTVSPESAFCIYYKY